MRIQELPSSLAIELDSEAETDRLGRAMAAVVEPNTVIGLIGPLGAGKTRLVRAIASALGVSPAAVSSPTFVLIHEYEGRLPVYHFDAYRLVGPEQFEALGVLEYWHRGGLCLVEWADRVLELLPDSAWRLTIEVTGHESRRALFASPKNPQIRRALTGDNRGL